MEDVMKGALMTSSSDQHLVTSSSDQDLVTSSINQHLVTSSSTSLNQHVMMEPPPRTTILDSTGHSIEQCSLQELTRLLDSIQADVGVLINEAEDLEGVIQEELVTSSIEQHLGSSSSSQHLVTSSSDQHLVTSSSTQPVLLRPKRVSLKKSPDGRRHSTQFGESRSSRASLPSRMSLGSSSRSFHSSWSISLINESNPVSPLAANIPCNDKGTDFKTLASQTIASLMAEVINFDPDEVDASIAINTWKTATKKRDAEVYFKTDKFSSQRVILATTTVKCAVDLAVDYILNPASRFLYDNLVKESYELERFDDTTTFNYCSLQAKACTMSISVDICYLATLRTVDSTTMIGYSSVLDSPFAPSIADVQRGWLYHSGWAMEPTGNEGEFKLYYLMHVDLRLKDLPCQTKNFLLEKQGLIIVRLKENLEELYAVRKPRRKENIPLDLQEQDPFETEAVIRNESLEMNLAAMKNAQQLYRSPQWLANRRDSDQSSQLDMVYNNESDINPMNFEDARPDLFFWSLDERDEDTISEVDISDYVTMGNSAAASLFREYINVLEAVRFSAVCPDKLSWKVSEKNDEMWTLEKVGSSIQCMAGVANIRATEKEIKDFLWDPRTRFTYDKTLHKTKVVAEINDDLRIVYSHHKAQYCFIGHGRDFLYFQYNRQEGDKQILAHASCTHPKCPVDPQIQRSIMYETGFIIEPLSETGISSVVYIVKVDFGGYIPQKLVRWVKRRQPKILYEIKKYFER